MHVNEECLFWNFRVSSNEGLDGLHCKVRAVVAGYLDVRVDAAGGQLAIRALREGVDLDQISAGGQGVGGVHY